METKDKVKDNLKLENVEDLEPKVKKKSLIKFIHVFESNSDKIPEIRRSKKERKKEREKKRLYDKKLYNLNREYNRLEKIWQVADSYYYYLHKNTRI